MSKLIIYDATRKKSLLDEGWAIGALWSWMWHGADGVLGATSWEEALDWACNRGITKKITRLSFWGHGSPGDAYINGDPLSQYIYTDSQLDQLGQYMNRKGLFWLRTCSSFHGKEGLVFAKDLADILDCRVAAHTYKIVFPFHSGLHSLRPSEKPTWSALEGSDGEGGTKWSCWKCPNTISTFANSFPDDW